MARWLGARDLDNSRSCSDSGNMPSFSAASKSTRLRLSGIAGRENLDNSPTIWISRIPPRNRALKTSAWPQDVRRDDVRKGLRCADSCVRCMYSSHIFEPFPYAESLAIARGASGLLVRGSILRIVVPDPALIVREYLADAGAQAARIFLSRLSLNHSLQDFVHPGSRHSRAKLDSDRSRSAAIGKALSSQIGQLQLEVRRRESLPSKRWRRTFTRSGPPQLLLSRSPDRAAARSQWRTAQTRCPGSE
jgi:hypothetical protein